MKKLYRIKAINNWKWNLGKKTMKFPFQTWFWIKRRILYIEMPFSYIKLFNWENIGYVAYPPEALFWSLKEDKYIHCRWMTSFVYLRNLATSDIPISGFPGWGCASEKYTNCQIMLRCVAPKDSRIHDLLGSTNCERWEVAKADTIYVDQSAVHHENMPV